MTRWRLLGTGSLLVLALLLISLSWHGAGESTDPPPASGIGPTGPVGPVDRSCEGVSIAPGNDIQSVIDGHPPGTTYCLSPGTYRIEQPLRPKEGDALIGHRGAVISGSKVLTDWRKNAHGWSAIGFLPTAPGEHGECQPDVPTCAYAEDVFADKRRLSRVASLDAVTAGTVHADYSSNTITIGDDPQRHLVEQALAPSLVSSTADNVTVANLVLEEAANEAQTAAVESRQPHDAGTSWRITANEVRLHHGVGLGISDGAVVTGNYLHHQGQLGYGAWGAGSVIRDNEIAFNGVAGYSWAWEAGGGKSWQTERQTITHNYVHDNHGPGLWDDGGTIDTEYSANRITGNWGAGIQHELSYDATIKDNEISGNGVRHKGWAWDAGIQIQSSGGTRLIEIAGNAVSDNANGIVLIDSGHRVDESPAPHGPHLVRNVWVHDNRVRMAAGQTTGAVQDIGDTAVFSRNHNRFEGNTYSVPSLTEPQFAWNDGELDWGEWRGLGNDADGRADRR
ncbi:right-handed parallel beta-helix repeat-containing protein [Kribbella sp. C-35]|uniref:right-handed parallel beta-helix repeat-containing protein n=1 Tax=Kribbella sp. C-35 TaxID=2789276 RepID=UPI00397876C2